jgi:hypothetical protein
MRYSTVAPPSITMDRLTQLSWNAVVYSGPVGDGGWGEPAQACIFRSVGTTADFNLSTAAAPAAVSLGCPARISNPVKSSPISDPMTGDISLKK